MNIIGFLGIIAITILATIFAKAKIDASNPQFPPPISPQADILITTTPTPTSTPTLSPENFPDQKTYRYPNSKILSQTNTTLTLESTDSPQIITTWYKSLLDKLDLNVKNYVNTNTNDNVENKLSVAGSGQSISVSVSKNATANETTININFSK